MTSQTLVLFLISLAICAMIPHFTHPGYEIHEKNNKYCYILDYNTIIRYLNKLENLMKELDPETSYNCYLIQREEMLIIEITIFGDKYKRYKCCFDKKFSLEEFKADPDKVLSEAAISAVVLGA